MEKFLDSLREEGYKKNTVETYRRVLEYFRKFLDFYGFDEKNFDEEKLYNFVAFKYKTEKSFRTAMSAIQHYLRFRGVKKRFKFQPPETGEFKEFRLLKEEELSKLLRFIDRLRSADLRTAMLLIVFAGLTPSEISKLKVSSYGKFMDIPILQEGKVKRFIVNRVLREELDRKKEELLPVSPIVSTKPSTVKVTFHRIVKQSGIDVSIDDFRDNYAARLINLGLPLDIVVEYSGRSLERVSYINRVLKLESKADVIEKVFKKRERE